MDIQFEAPIEFRLEIIETDERVPSIKVEVRIVVNQFQHRSQYDGAFWIECAVWDSFLKGLHSAMKEANSLHDISGNFDLTIQSTELGLMLSWQFEKSDIGVKRDISIKYSSAIDEEMLARIRQSFDDFPTWW